MPGECRISEGQILEGPLFSEHVRVETLAPCGVDTWAVGVVGCRTEKFSRVILTSAQLEGLRIHEPTLSFNGDGQLLRLGLQAQALRIAYEFDPYFGLSISRVDPLPHQLEAVYDHLLKLPRVRFLLADDAGAGKTIMAGLLLRELKLRGLAERVLVVCPATLAFQWQRELKEKFEEKFTILKGEDIRVQYGINQWEEHPRVITSLDLAKREDILPGLRQVHWDLIIVDEAHRMSAIAQDKKSLRYRLGELLRDSSDHLLLLTATPHKGDPANFALFLQLIDFDAFADVKSIKMAMDQGRAPFYLRRTKEAMVYFPERQADGTWAARKIFTKRIPHSVKFELDGEEDQLYRDVTKFVKAQSVRAAAHGDDPRARAVGFLMVLYQRRLASSVYAVRRSLENRAKRLEDGLREAQELALAAPPDMPDSDEWDEMEEAQREHWQEIAEAITLARDPRQVQEEVAELRGLVASARAIEAEGTEVKLSWLRKEMEQQGFFTKPDQRLLIFTEYRDTLDYLVERLKGWGFKVGFIHGGMKPGTRDDPGTRLYAEQQFRDGAIQVLVATEAAGEGINLQCCNILFNYDIPWNPNRLEQRMGRIHRYGQTKDCLIFNFVAVNTVEGAILQRLLTKLQEIRNALQDDAVFNVVGEVLPANQIDRVFRDFYAGRLGQEDLEDRLLSGVNEERFKGICQNALEGLASKRLNLEMLVERRARAQEYRVVPETIARFLREAAFHVPLAFKPVAGLTHAFAPGPTPIELRRYETERDWKCERLANRYERISTDREVAEKNSLEWVTPGHPLFEALRRHAEEKGQIPFGRGACFFSLTHEKPVRIDFYSARVVDGLAQDVHRRIYAVELSPDGTARLCDPHILGNLMPATTPESLPEVAAVPEARAWLHEKALAPFLDEMRAERTAEVERIARHVEVSLTELMQREDEIIGHFADAVQRGVEGAAGNLKQAETRHKALQLRRDQRRKDLERQKSLSLQGVERVTSVLVLPHPERDAPDVKNLRSDPVTEAIAMRVVIEHEKAQQRLVTDVHEKDLGYDITSLDTKTGDLRLIEIKGIGAETGTVFLTPNERRVAEDRPDCFWLYVVTDCKTSPRLRDPISNPARLPWHEVKKVDHYYLSLDAIKPSPDGSGARRSGGA